MSDGTANRGKKETDRALEDKWDRASKTHDWTTWDLVSRRFGPEMNRGKVANALRAGFELIREENAYLDVVKAIEARKPLRGR